jgi:uncharacterized delta-60 repeat protein
LRKFNDRTPKKHSAIESNPCSIDQENSFFFQYGIENTIRLFLCETLVIYKAGSLITMKTLTSPLAVRKNNIQPHVLTLFNSKPCNHGGPGRVVLFSLILFVLFFSQLIWSGTSSKLFAQAGSLDTTFNSADIGFSYGDGANNRVMNSTLQSDGKIIIGGKFTSYNGTSRNHITRLNTDGSLDTTFNPGTGANFDVWSTSLQSDGKIIIGGVFTAYNGTARNRIARLNTDGTLDASFNPGTGADSIVLTTSLQSDGKIIIGGWFNSYNGTSRNRIARLNTDGILDTSFIPGTGADSTVLTTSLQSDGKIIIGGDFTSYNGTGRNRIARLNTDGTLDTTFNPGTGTNNAVYTACLQSDGKIIIGGNFTSYDGIGRNNIARLNTDGTLDTTFNPGTGTNYYVYYITLQSDGKIIIGGWFNSYNGTSRNRIARLNTDGTLDTSFNPGTGANSWIWTTTLQSDGKIIIGGNFTTYNSTGTNHITRLNTDGILDVTFNPGTGANLYVLTTSFQNDGKIIIGGAFYSYNGTGRNRIARLNSDGTLDTTFNPGAGANNAVYTTCLQSDGKIIIGGVFTAYNGTARNFIARVNTDGTLDTTFNPGTGVNGAVLNASIQSDGKIVIGGTFISYNGTGRNRIARLNTDGTLDTTFNPGTGTNGAVLNTSIQSDGKIIIGGIFYSYDGIASNCIARLNSDGTLDTSFNQGTGANNTIRTIFLQNDWKIIIGGDFTSYNGTGRNRIARLNSDGTLDSTFDPGTGANGSVSTISLQNDGKIIIGGTFYSYNGTGRNRIARLNSDGTLDTNFNPGTGANNGVNTSTLQSDGKIVIGGSFTSYNGVGKNRIARILGVCSNSISSFTQTSCGSYTSPSGNYIWTSSGVYSDTLVNAGGCDSIVTINLTILPVPVVMLSAQGSTSFCVGDSVILSASPLMSTYQWYRYNNPISGATSADYVAKSSGNYKCIAQNQVLCSDTSNIITVSTPCIPTGPNILRLSQTNLSDTHLFHVFPNPATGIFQVETSGGQLKVFNSLGKLMLSFETFKGESMFDISEYPDGIYLVSFVSGESEYYQKIMLVR